MKGNITQQESLYYEDRFLENWAGSIINSPATAIIELVANCWDAYATEVEIVWPDHSTQKSFSITDNGKGMTRKEFQSIWRTLAYDRVSRYGTTTSPPEGLAGLPRHVFGRNGKGRFASFCFSNEYRITSRKDGQKFVCKVYRSANNPLILEELEFIENGVTGHGTQIESLGNVARIVLSEEQAREIIGSRFLADPAFRVYLNSSQITFNDISGNFLDTQEIEIPNIGTVKIFHIDTHKADKTTQQHGIAWWVLNRAVGECQWRSTDYQRILDGRTSEAKRYTFIVQADFLNAADAVREDWSWFKDDNPIWLTVRPIVQDKIRDMILQSNKEEREIKRQAVIEKVGGAVNRLAPMSRERVETFITEVIDNCPNIRGQELIQLSSILTKLEQTKSRYGLLEVLHNQDPHDLDALHDVLTQWTIGMAKIVLDEIQNRLKLIGELKAKIQVPGIDEVHELQPLFEKGLWMFGPQFESIEFSANQGMTTVIRNLFKDSEGKGSRNRPDFVVLPDCSVGFYARASYDEEYNEDGVEHLVIVDLKTTSLGLGSKEKDQVWKYVKELITKGHLRRTTRVDGFVLGDRIEPGEEEPTTHGNVVKIMPLLYSTILNRAEKRLLNLHAKVKDAPFLVTQREELRKFIEPVDISQQSLAT